LIYLVYFCMFVLCFVANKLSFSLSDKFLWNYNGNFSTVHFFPETVYKSAARVSGNRVNM